MQIETTMWYHLILTSQNGHHQKVYKQLMLESVWRKGKPLILSGGRQTGVATMENSVGFP